MPVYTFQCSKCDHTFEIFATYSNYNNSVSKSKCPKCDSKKIERSYSTDLQNMTGSVIKSDDQIKLGDLANRNRDRLSDDHKTHLYHKHNEYKDSSFQKPMPDGSKKIRRGPRTKWT